MEPWLRPLYDAEGMRAVDRWAIEEQRVPSLELMEAAGRALAEAVAELSPDGPVRVVCGKGNNAGDGFVAARLLEGMGFGVEVLLLWPREELKGDAAVNLSRIEAEHVGSDLDARLAGSGTLVDAVFGTGFEGAPREPAAAAIEAINRCGAPVVACDISSGVDASSGEVERAAVEADFTVTFHAAKLGQWIAPGKWRTGALRVAPIGIPAGAPAATAGGTIDPSVLALAPTRGAGSTKFSSGQVTVAGGSRGLTGAVRMSSLGAIRAGAGYATVAIPADLNLVFELAQPEVMSAPCPGGDGCLTTASAEAVLRAFERAAAGVIGPGLGRDPGSLELAREVAGAIACPLVIDADGLTAFAGQPDRLAARESPTVLTPHAGELGRLLGRDSDQIAAHRLAAAREAAEASGAVVVLKGDDTIVTDGERVAVNAISAPGLATAGSGDVLSGVTAALLARGLEPFAAACAAVVGHARAGRDAASRLGAAESVIATDVIDSIPVGMRPAAPVE
ncbi:MAG: ADP-dependent NAD(P)H-hydrate dehydratase / NAD(P)H-hydrate epimerase [Solirubrobacterales bacterium]|nr:ADP-dependent NAD(P)H-hydrate dehydratase / NAD(P)H-hydrate epimerase [Solirubrobacterales bacterium]